jgi:hypothetical protein
LVIRALAGLGLAWRVKRPSAALVERRRKLQAPIPLTNAELL